MQLNKDVQWMTVDITFINWNGDSVRPRVSVENNFDFINKGFTMKMVMFFEETVDTFETNFKRDIGV